MRQNPYDDDVFFQKYSAMERSQKGLDGAGEWETLKTLFPDFSNRRVLDLGCGFGWHCRYAQEQGAASVTGVDLSENMLRVAREKTDAPNVTYLRAAMEDVQFPAEAFDIVISSLALHYVADYPALLARMHRWLTPGGALVCSVEHPVFTAEGSEDWMYDVDGNILHYPVDNYFSEGLRETSFLGERIPKYHRTLTTYLGELIKQGFTLTGLVEPQPPARMLPALADELRRPMMLLFSARKEAKDLLD